METAVQIVLLIAVLVALLLSGLPVAFSLGLLSAVVLLSFLGGERMLGMVPTIAYRSMYSFVFTAIPLFILMAEITLVSGMSKDLYEAASKWVGHLPGGLAIGGIGASAVFAALCGSSVATAATIGLVAVPEMEKRGYDRKLAIGSIAAGGTLGILIPPSIPLILYAVLTEQSVGKLFMAGFIPGIIIIVLFMVYIGMRVKKNPTLAPSIPTVKWADRLRSLRKTIGMVIVIIVVIGGIYTGVMTPTEAAAVGALFSLLLCALLYRRLNFQNLRKILMETVQTTAMISMIIMGALMFGYILTALQIPQQVANFVVSLSVSRWVVLILINILLLILGCFLDVSSVILITIPIIFPIITSLEFDPIWFGIVMTVNMEIACITPPVGMNLYVLKGIVRNSTMGEVIAGASPFVIVLFIGLAIMIAFPPISLWLPSTMIK